MLNRVEELVDHRGQPVGAVDEPDVGGAGKDGESGVRQTGQVAEDAAAAQAEQLDGVLRSRAVGVPDNDQSSARRSPVSPPAARRKAGMSSCFIFSTSVGKASGFGATRSYSSFHGVPAKSSGVICSMPAQTSG